MLSGTLCATVFVNLFVTKVVHGDDEVFRAEEGTIRQGYDFKAGSHLLKFIQEIIYLRGIWNEFWGVQLHRNWLNSLVCEC